MVAGKKCQAGDIPKHERVDDKPFAIGKNGSHELHWIISFQPGALVCLNPVSYGMSYAKH
jgi:hypothetical protein